MRTKHILTALAIPALFAACVADDFNEAITSGDMAQRALLSENFKLNFGGADTRFSAGEGDKLELSYETGDKIGGAIIDEFSYDENHKPKFDVVPYVSTNHPFVLNEQGVWSIEHTMVEGTYLFYFPYNENNHARTAPMYSIPVMQDLSGKDGKFDPKAAVEKYSMGVGAQFLDKEDLSASLQLVNIFGYAKIKVVVDNHYAGGNVDKIVLQPVASDKTFKLNGQISNRKVHDLYALLEKGTTTEYQSKLKEMTTTGAFALDEDGEDADYYEADLNKSSNVIVGKAPEGTALVKDAQNNKTFETYLVIPATSESEAMDINVYLYTTEGDIYEGTMEGFYVPRNGVNSETVVVKEAEKIPYVVTSEADWNNNVGMLAKDQIAEFIIAGEDFAITNNTKYPTNGATITVEGDLEVAGNNVTIKNVDAGNVIVRKGAKLTTDGTFSAESIENEGTVEFAVVYDEEDEDLILDYGSTNVPGVGKVTNKPGAVLNVLKDAVATFTLVNEIDDKESSLPHGAVTINGQATLAGKSENNGDITIAAGGSLRGQFTNNKEVTYPVSAQKEEDITNRYTPTITNNGEIYVTTGTVTNNGEIVNNDEISCSRTNSAAEFVNAGVIELGEKVQMLITDNTGGEIILNALEQTGWSVENENGTVSYKTKATDNDKSYDFSKVGKSITKLYVTGNLGITSYGENLGSVEVTNNATLALPKYDATVPATSLDELIIKEGATVTASSEDAVVGDLYVEKNARLTINADNIMRTTNVYNKGRIYVGGLFTTAMTEDEAVTDEYNGEFRNTTGSDTGNIEFAKEPEKEPTAEEKAYTKAIQDLVTAWVTNTGLIGKDKGDIQVWEGVTLEKVRSTSWSSTTTAWVGVARKAVVDAYKALNSGKTLTEQEFDALIKNDRDVAGIITAAIATEKAKGPAALSAEIAKLTPDKWLGTSVYVQEDNSSAPILKVGGTTENTLTADFVAYIKGDDFAGKYGTDGVDKNNYVFLSANEYTVAGASVPAYSYIRTYAGAEEYDVMKILCETEWDEAKITELASADLETLDGVKTAISAIYAYSKNENGDPLVQADIEQSGILDYFTNVRYNWKYTNNCIKALNDLFVPGK